MNSKAFSSLNLQAKALVNLQPVAIVVGAAGQDGRLAVVNLVSRGFRVFCIYRNCAGWWSRDEFAPFDVSKSKDVSDLIQQVCPSVVYYFAAESKSSEDRDLLVGDEPLSNARRIHEDGVKNFMDTLSRMPNSPRFLYASSSLVFRPQAGLINEASEMQPEGHYAQSKLRVGQLCQDFRSNRGLEAFVVYLFNHESAFRKENFLTRKLIRAALSAHQGANPRLEIGDFTAQVDWGYAPDYVQGMVELTEQGTPGDYVMASGVAHTVLEMCEAVFGYFELDYRDFAVQAGDALHKKPEMRIGDSSRIQRTIGWKYARNFEELVERLCLDTIEFFAVPQGAQSLFGDFKGS